MLVSASWPRLPPMIIRYPSEQGPVIHSFREYIGMTIPVFQFISRPLRLAYWMFVLPFRLALATGRLWWEFGLRDNALFILLGGEEKAPVIMEDITEDVSEEGEGG